MSQTKQRSTLSPQNALKFKKIFDLAIKHQQDILIPIKGSPSGFHIKCSDALKWLILYHDTEHTNTLGEQHLVGGYARLRGQVRFKAYQDPKDSKNKIKLEFAANNHTCYEGEIEEISKNPNREIEILEKKDLTLSKDFWKGQLIRSFIENPLYHKGDKIFKLKNLSLDAEDKEFVHNLLSGIKGCIYDVDDDSIVAQMKIETQVEEAKNEEEKETKPAE